MADVEILRAGEYPATAIEAKLIKPYCENDYRKLRILMRIDRQGRQWTNRRVAWATWQLIASPDAEHMLIERDLPLIGIDPMDTATHRHLVRGRHDGMGVPLPRPHWRGWVTVEPATYRLGVRAGRFYNRIVQVWDRIGT